MGLIFLFFVFVLPAYAGVILNERGWSKQGFHVLPAYAGVIQEVRHMKPAIGGLTRVCGGDPKIPLNAKKELWSYPRMRG